MDTKSDRESKELHEEPSNSVEDEDKDENFAPAAQNLAEPIQKHLTGYDPRP
jgi:hypothetical protein